MIRILSIALLGGGVGLTIFGLEASRSFSSDVSHFFTGTPTDRALWMIIGGVVMLLAGAAGLFSARPTAKTAR